MTKELAVDKIKCFPDWNLDDEWLLEDEMQELSDMAVYALEKQIPKKPNIRNYNGRKRKCCPICGYFYNPASRYCPKCGQALENGRK